jgi:hypothetical protein
MRKNAAAMRACSIVPLISEERERDREDIDAGKSIPVQQARANGEGTSPAWHWASVRCAHLSSGINLLNESYVRRNCWPAQYVVEPTSDNLAYSTKEAAIIMSVSFQRTGDQYLGRTSSGLQRSNGSPRPRHGPTLFEGTII